MSRFSIHNLQQVNDKQEKNLGDWEMNGENIYGNLSEEQILAMVLEQSKLEFEKIDKEKKQGKIG